MISAFSFLIALKRPIQQMTLARCRNGGQQEYLIESFQKLLRTKFILVTTATNESCFIERKSCENSLNLYVET
jgi:hypothetical protein